MKMDPQSGRERNTPLRVLHLEDSRRDAELIQSMLEAEGLNCDVVHVQNREQFEAALTQDRFDVILCDYSLPHYNGFSALDFARRKAPAVPFILLSGSLGEELAVESLKTGATDYILKQRLNRLVPAVRRAVREAADQAEKKRAEEALERMRRHNELILHSTGEGICGLDLNGRATFVNSSAASLLGYRAEEMIGQPVHEFLRHTRPDGSVCAEKDCPIYAAYKRGVPHHAEDELFWRKDGTSFPAEYVSNPIWSEPHELIGAAVTFRDITERKQAEQRIREQATLLDKAQDAILVGDLEGRILFWNKSAERLYGWSAAEAVGKNTAELLFKEPTPQLAEARRQVRERGEWMGEFQQTTKDGKSIIVESRWALVCDSEGKPKSKLVINTDITAKKELEAQFLRTQRLESIGTLAGGIAHDLNNILAPILMAADLLQDQLSDEISRQMLDTVKTSVQRGSDMVKQILSFARGVVGEHAVLQPKHLVAEMGKLAKETFPRLIEIKTRIAKDLHLIKGDATQLHQVLLNLCVNARDAMPKGGTLRVEAENALLRSKQPHPDAEPVSGPYILLTVSDTGAGIPPELRQKIFEPFFTTKEIGKGTGLGLSTVMAIVKNHGGFLEVLSEVGKGTTFQVYLPATVESQPQSAECQALGPPIGQGETILLVDDEIAMLEIAKETLGIFNYRVLTAKNGAEALAVYQQHKEEIQVVVTDMMMPILDGPAMVRALREIDPQVKVICVSGLDSRPNLTEVGPLDVQACLTKPYPTEKLLTVLREVLAADGSTTASNAKAPAMRRAA